MTTYVLTITGEVTREQAGHAGDLITVLGGTVHGRFASIDGPAAYWFTISSDHEQTLREVLRSDSGKAVLTWLTVSRTEVMHPAGQI
jgi:hypothetical protein